MHKLFLLSLLAFTLSTRASARVTFGPEIGLHMNTVYLGGNTNTPAMGPRAGLITDIGFGSFALQPGVFYSMKGGKTASPDSVYTKFAIHYLEIPVLFMYRHKLGPGKIFAGLGPDIAVELSSKMDISVVSGGKNIYGLTAPVSGSSRTSQLFKKTDIAAYFSAGYMFSFGLLIRVFCSTSMPKYIDNTSSFIDNRTYGVSLAFLFGN